eukprot:267151_1
MKSVYIVYVLSMLITLAFSKCGQSGNRKLGITTKSGWSWADHDGNAIYANIFADSNWKGWRRLDTVGCDDFEEGNTDWFDDFEIVHAEWESVSLYNCHASDSLLVDTIHYWGKRYSSSALSTQSRTYFQSNRDFQLSCASSGCMYSDIYNQAAAMSGACNYLRVGGSHCCKQLTINPDKGGIPNKPDCRGEHG